MKVTFASYDSENEVSGVSSWLKRLLPRLQASGLEVEAHVLAAEGLPGVNCAWFEKHGIPYRWKPWDWNIRKAVRHCLAMLAEGKPDIYVPNCLLPAYFAAAHAQRNGVATIGVLHSDDPFYWGVMEEFVTGRPENGLSAVVVVSEFLEARLRESGLGPTIPLRRIGCGVPVPEGTATFSNGVFRLVYTGRLMEEQKRISDVARALCAATKEDGRIEAWIIGEGGARPRVQGIIDEAGLTKRIRLLGRVDISKIHSLLCDCQAFVLLSDYEGLPVSLLEAMAAGVVPICLEMRSGIREAIEPGLNGLIVKDRADDFCAAVRSLTNDPARWQTLSQHARATVKEKFSEEKCAAQWLDLLQSLSANRWRNSLSQPLFLQLPPRNAKFGRSDQRCPAISQPLQNLRNTLGHYREQFMKTISRR